MMIKTYSEKLQDVRWQKLRLKVLERDEWVCQKCFTIKEGQSLHVHHKKYSANPWDAPIDTLSTLCSQCHEDVETAKKQIKDFFDFDNPEFDYLKYTHVAELLSVIKEKELDAYDIMLLYTMVRHTNFNKNNEFLEKFLNY